MRKDDYLYFHGKTDDVWEAPYLSDLLHGELKIYDVPFDYRIKTAYIYARNAALAVWDGSETANQKKLETKLIETQLLNDIIMAETKGLDSRAAVLRKTYIELFMDFHFEDSQGRIAVSNPSMNNYCEKKHSHGRISRGCCRMCRKNRKNKQHVEPAF